MQNNVLLTIFTNRSSLTLNIYWGGACFLKVFSQTTLTEGGDNFGFFRERKLNVGNESDERRGEWRGILQTRVGETLKITVRHNIFGDTTSRFRSQDIQFKESSSSGREERLSDFPRVPRIQVLARTTAPILPPPQDRQRGKG